MRSSTAFLIGAVLALVFGIGFLLLPALVLSIYGVAGDVATSLMGRFFSVALLQMGVTLWILKDIRDAPAILLFLSGVQGGRRPSGGAAYAARRLHARVRLTPAWRARRAPATPTAIQAHLLDPARKAPVAAEKRRKI